MAPAGYFTARRDSDDASDRVRAGRCRLLTGLHAARRATSRRHSDGFRSCHRAAGHADCLERDPVRRARGGTAGVRPARRGELPAPARDHLARRPWSRAAALLAARCLSQLDYPDEAEPYYHRAGRLSLDDLQVRAYGMVRSNQHERAIRAYQEIVARWPDNVLALRRLAAVELAVQNRTESLALADRLIAIPGGEVVGFTLRGSVHHDDGNRAEAVAAYERVLQLDPELRDHAAAAPAVLGRARRRPRGTRSHRRRPARIFGGRSSRSRTRPS